MLGYHQPSKPVRRVEEVEECLFGAATNRMRENIALRHPIDPPVVVPMFKKFDLIIQV